MRLEAVLIIITGTLIAIIGIFLVIEFEQYYGTGSSEVLGVGLLVMFGIALALYAGLGFEELEKNIIGYSKDEKENEIIELAKKSSGQITVSDVMDYIKLDLRTSKILLERLRNKNICFTDVEDYKSTGIETYYFPDFNPNYVKRLQDLSPDNGRTFIQEQHDKQESVGMKKHPDYQKITIILMLIFGIAAVIYYILSLLFR